jgi:hypothetical protein
MRKAAGCVRAAAGARRPPAGGHRRGRLRRIVAAAATVPATVVLAASPAAAHTTGGTGPTDFRTVIDAVRPTVSGLSVRVLELGSRLELTNRSGAEVVVLGYEGEPYLRVGPAGVWQNLRSPATYLNRDRQGRTPVPADVRADAPPRWQKLSEGQTARWHDHRVHWMGGPLPVGVRRGASPVVLSRWEVPLRVGGRDVVVAGRLLWVPGPRPWPWLVGAAGLAVLAAAVVRRRVGLAAAAMVVVAVDLFHVAGTAWAPGAPGSPLARFVVAGVVPALGWAAGIAGARLLLRRATDAGAALVAVAGFVALVLGGLSDLSVLGRSQVPFVWGPTVARAAVAATVGLGVVVAARGGWLAWAASAGGRQVATAATGSPGGRR